MDRTVSVHDISALINHGSLSAESAIAVKTYNTVANEQLSAPVLRGKQLFYDAFDPRLALQKYISCAACHNDGAQDGRVWDLTGFGEGLRNTIDLRGRAGMGHGPLHWSANFDEVQDFEGQIRDLSSGLGLMSDTDFHAGTRSQPLGQPKAGISSDLDALAAYVASLNSFADSPYRNADGSLSPAGVAGRALFASHGCADCHHGNNFSDSAPDNLHDIGTLKASSGKRLGGPLTGIDTPTLRGVWATAPYLHDGSAATLAAAVTAHNGASLSAAGMNQLVAYLLQIDGREPAPGSVNPQPPANAIFSSGFED
jgi:cytochrome c peroxidase